MLVTQLDGEAIGKMIAKSAERCTASDGKLLLVMFTRDDNQCFLPLLEKGLRVHQDSVEFVDSADGELTLPFSRIARIEIDNKDDWEFPMGKFAAEPGKNNLTPFRKPREN
jgi:hypothetical protein